MTAHALIDDPALQLRVAQRYEAEVATLQRLGFRLLAYLLETESPFSAILQLPMLLLMLANREVVALRPPLRLGVATVLLQHPEPSTVAVCMGKGLKLYTCFTDQTLLISSTFQSLAIPRPASGIIRLFPSASIESAWPAHCQSVQRLEAQARQVRPTTTYAEFQELSEREEDLSQYD